MKKLSPLLLVVLVIVAAVAAYTFFGSQTTPPQSSETTTSASNAPQQAAQTTEKISRTTMSSQQGSGASPVTGNDEEPEEQIKPAPEAYASSEEALTAVLKGAKDYDDSILEQFTLPDPNCSWCSEFYSSVRDLALNQNTPQEQRAYLAELLAISGRTENVQALIEAVKNAPSNDTADLYAEALELSLGREDIVTLLGEQMTSTNDTLREASVAAVTNQGTKLAAELLIKDAKEKGDPDLYYTQGIGIGEAIPEEEAIPVYQEFVRERLPNSHLGVKALLNAGLPGVQAVFDELENSPNPDADKSLLKDAADHINIDDEIVALADRKLAENNNSNSVELARIIREQSQNADQAADGEGEDLGGLPQ
ncbi:MAG: hypothetical protein RL518_1571 [Pseudomonadota bacterium]|jgi:hypothetical protein